MEGPVKLKGGNLTLGWEILGHPTLSMKRCTHTHLIDPFVSTLQCLILLLVQLCNQLGYLGLVILNNLLFLQQIIVLQRNSTYSR